MEKQYWETMKRMNETVSRAEYELTGVAEQSSRVS